MKDIYNSTQAFFLLLQLQEHAEVPSALHKLLTCQLHFMECSIHTLTSVCGGLLETWVLWFVWQVQL